MRRTRCTTRRRWASLAVAATALWLSLATGCKTTGSQGPAVAESAVDAARNAGDIPLPADPLFVVSLRPDKLDAAAERLVRPEGEEATNDDGASLTRSSREPPTHVASAMVARLLAGETGLLGTIRSADEDFRLQALDRHRPILIAPSATAHGDLLRNARYLAPLDELGAFPRQLPYRMLLPASEPKELAAEIDAHCDSADGDASAGDAEEAGASDEEWLAGHCEAVMETSVDGRWLVVDLARVDDTSASNVTSISEQSETYFDRLTPASVALFDPQAAIAVHGRARSMWKFAVLRTFLEAPLPSGDEDRAPIRGRDTSLGETLTKLSRTAAPGSREYEDATLRVNVRPDGLNLKLVRTYTEHGKAVAGALDKPAELATVQMADPMFEVNWSADTRAGFRAAAVPEWLKSVAASYSSYHPEDTLEHYSPWGVLHATVAYPTAVLSGLEAMQFEDGPNPTDALKRLGDVHGMRVAFDVRKHESDQKKVDIKIRAAAVLHAPASSNLDASADTFVRFLRWMGLSARLRSEIRDSETMVLKLLVGLKDSRFATIFDQPARLQPGLQVRIHPDQMLKRAGDTGLVKNLGLQRRTLERYTDQNLVYRHRFGARASRAQLYLGHADPAIDGEVPVETELRPAAGAPKCVEAAVATIERMDGIDMDSPDFDDLEQLESTMTVLRRHYETCKREAPQVRDDLRWRYAVALHQLGEARKVGFFWSDAAEAFGRACELGHEPSCQAAQKMQARAKSHRLPSVDATVPDYWSLPDHFVLVDAEGLRVNEQIVPYASSQFSHKAADLMLKGRVLDSTHLAGFDRMGLMAVAPDAEVPWDRLETVATTFRSVRGASARYSAYADRMDGIMWMVHPPETFGRIRQPHYLFTAFWSGDFEAAKVEGHQALAVTIHRDGVQLRDGKTELAPAADCPKDGPTVCGDLQQLRERLAAFKAKYPDRDRVVIRTSPDVDYRRFVQVLSTLSFEKPADRPRRYRHFSDDGDRLFPKKYIWIGED